MNKNNDVSTIKTVIGIIAGIILVIVIVLLLLRNCSADKKYTVIFDSNGGSIVDKVTVKENETIKRPKDPTRKGYVFVGWYYKDKLFKFSTKITHNMRLEARWNLDSGISLNIKDLILELGEEFIIEITSLPKKIELDDLVWISSNKKIVTVDKNGKIKALKTGKVTITVKTKDGKYKATCTITVKEKESFETNNQTSKSKSKSPSKKKTTTVSPPSKESENNVIIPSQPEENPETTKYVITLTADVQEVTNDILRYYFEVKANGNVITNYKGFRYNSRPVKPNSGTIASVNIDKSIKKVQLILNNGSTVTASVIYR